MEAMANQVHVTKRDRPRDPLVKLITPSSDGEQRVHGLVFVLVMDVGVVQLWTSHAVNFDVLAVDPFYHGVVGPRKPQMVTRYERILLRLHTFTEENHSAHQESFAGSLRREMEAILTSASIEL